jgi:hypothetical protein
MFTFSYAAAFGAIQLMPQIVPGLPQVQEQVQQEVAARKKAATSGTTTRAIAAATREATASTKVAAPVLAPPSTRPGGPPPFKVASMSIYQKVAPEVTKVQEIGGLIGRVLLAILAVYIVSRRNLIRVFLMPGLVVMPLVFGWAAVHGLTELKFGMFFAGLLTVAQFSFWGNYLPRVYPIHLRGTGESFAANIGGRMIGTCFAWVTIKIAAEFTPKVADAAGQDLAAAHAVAYTAAAVGFGVYFLNFILSFVLPEPGLTGGEHE